MPDLKFKFNSRPREELSGTRINEHAFFPLPSQVNMMTKSFYSIPILFFLMVILPGITPYAQVTISNIDSTSLYSYEWTLWKIINADLKEVDNSHIPTMLLSPGANSRFSGNTVCNKFEGEIIHSGRNKLQFTNIKEIKYNCEDILDSVFMAMLWNVDNYIIQDDELIFYSKGGTVLARFYPTITEKSFYKKIGLEGTWRQSLLKQSKGWVDLEILDSVPHLVFSKTNFTQVTGYTGCNSFSARFKIENNIIHFSEIQTTGENYSTSNVEQNFTTYLSGSSMYMVGDDLLSFWKNSSLIMQFNRVNDIKSKNGKAWRFLEKKRKNTVFSCGNK